MSRTRPIVAKALQRGQEFCTNYLSMKEDLAHLSCFRKKIKFDAATIGLAKSGHQGNYFQQNN